MLNEAKEINRLPVITWRWLKVNELNLKELNLPEIKPYEREFLKTSSHGNVVVKSEFNIIDFDNSIKDSSTEYGVSEEVLKIAKDHKNTGVFIHAPRNEASKEPIKIEFVMDKNNASVIDNNIIVAEENSHITVVMEYKTEGEVQAFHNGITKIYAKDGARVNIIKVQTMNDHSYHFDSNVGFIGYGAEINYVSVELGGKVSVTNYVNDLEKETSKADLKSIYLADKDRIVDLSYKMNHIGRRTESNIETRGVLKDKARKTFRGTLDFKKGAARSKGSEEEYALLLDSTVKSDAIPLLLCDEDDVEGAHAASAGKVDEEKLFYLMSRGFNEKEAKLLIVEGSFRHIIDEIPVEDLREHIEKEVQRRLINE
ncbi:Fe-S cluster assembly protein SufD [Clostridium sp. MSJ-4]|uniref:Fe-S cluster assembly protein SufD n=1 Tax=Clostridium simiarum TaxID=2841506 RepID=A0ABS6F3A1_9CLOT|nr:Fe-S cluster assembly protein SufD [Clostridium simiarum]MBU5592370.1 Fe-S cluster assembly protein SufD [Clostridium simiarum]